MVEYILGNNIPPADEPLLQEKLNQARVAMSVTELVTAIRERLPLYGPLTSLQIREFLLHSELHSKLPGEVVFKRNDYTNSLYSVLDGEVGIQINPDKPAEMVRLGPGQFFGEMGLISGRRRTATIVATQPALLLEVDRNTMVKLVRSVPEIKAVIDNDAVVRQIKTYLAPDIDDAQHARRYLPSAKVIEFKPNDTLIEEGAEDDQVYHHPQGLGDGVAQDRRQGHGAELPAGRQLRRRDGDADEIEALGDGARRRQLRGDQDRQAPLSARCSSTRRSCAARSKTGSSIA